MDEVSGELAFAYLSERSPDPSQSKTFNNNKSALNTIFKLTMMDSGISESPFAKIPNRVLNSQHQRPFTEEEFVRIYQAAPEPWRTASLIVWFTGLREKDVFFAPLGPDRWRCHYHDAGEDGTVRPGGPDPDPSAAYGGAEKTAKVRRTGSRKLGICAAKHCVPTGFRRFTRQAQHPRRYSRDREFQFLPGQFRYPLRCSWSAETRDPRNRRPHGRCNNRSVQSRSDVCEAGPGAPARQIG